MIDFDFGILLAEGMTVEPQYVDGKRYACISDERVEGFFKRELRALRDFRRVRAELEKYAEEGWEPREAWEDLAQGMTLMVDDSRGITAYCGDGCYEYEWVGTTWRVVDEPDSPFFKGRGEHQRSLR